MTDMWCNSWGGSFIFDFFSRNFSLANNRVEWPAKLEILFRSRTRYSKKNFLF